MAVDFRLYLITDRKVATKPLPEAVRMALEGGVRAVQLREKDLPIRDLLALAKVLRDITREFGAKLFINDRVDVAIAVGADGVHLGNASIPVHAVRKIVQDGMLIGASAHSPEEAWQVEVEGADFLTYGPVFATPSKLKYGQAVGLESMINAINKVSIPIFGLGGVKSGNIFQILSSGAFGVSMISSILASEDISASAAEMMGTIKKALAGERPGK